MQRYPGALIVIDFGTATTFDVVGRGRRLSRAASSRRASICRMEALHQAAAKLPRVAIHRAQKVIGKDTVAAMQSGVFWGYVALIEGWSTRIKAEYGKPMTVVATGGLASLFQAPTSPSSTISIPI